MKKIDLWDLTKTLEMHQDMFTDKDFDRVGLPNIRTDENANSEILRNFLQQKTADAPEINAYVEKIDKLTKKVTFKSISF